MGLRIRLTRTSLMALCCLVPTLLSVAGPSQGAAAIQGPAGGASPMRGDRAVMALGGGKHPVAGTRVVGRPSATDTAVVAGGGSATATEPASPTTAQATPSFTPMSPLFAS